MRKTLFAATAFAALAAGAQGQEKLKFAVFTPDAELTHQIVMKPFVAAVNKDSGGTLLVETFPNGALGRNPGLQTKMLQDGVADIAWVIPSYTPGVYLDDDVFELPNIIQNSVEGSVAAWRLLQKGMLRRIVDRSAVLARARHSLFLKRLSAARLRCARGVRARTLRLRCRTRRTAGHRSRLRA